MNKNNKTFLSQMILIDSNLWMCKNLSTISNTPEEMWENLFFDCLFLNLTDAYAINRKFESLIFKKEELK
jgi:hypothetical protein